MENIILKDLINHYSTMKPLRKIFTLPTQEGFINHCRDLHNNKYNYSKTRFIHTKEHITIICPKHGEFSQLAGSHYTGYGCRHCGHDYQAQIHTQTQEDVIKRFISVHGDKYDYSKVVFIGAGDPIIVGCPIHGYFDILPHRHYHGAECPDCAEKTRLAKVNERWTRDGKKKPGTKMTIEEFLEQAKMIHQDRYDYSKVELKTKKTKMIIICKIHGEFLMSVLGLLGGRGCKKCSNNVSSGSTHWLDYLGIPLREYRIKENKNRVVDGFDPSTNTCYQYHGDFYHGNPALYNNEDINPKTQERFGDAYSRTQRLDKELRDYGYHLITIWESEWIALKKQMK